MAHQTRRAGTLVLALLFAACSGQTATPAASTPASAAASAAASVASSAPSEAASAAPTDAPSASQGAAVIPQTGDLADFSSTINWQAAKGQKIFVAMTDQTDTDVLAQALPQFTKLTGIEVDYQKYEDVTQKELVDLQAGTGSIDVMQLDSQVIPQYVKSGYLADLGTFMADPTQYDASWYKPDDLVGSFVKLGQQDGKQYAIPAYLETTLLYYRKDLFDAKGMRCPTRSTTSRRPPRR